MVEVLICTYNEGVEYALSIPLIEQKGLSYLISHQVMDGFSSRYSSSAYNLIKKRKDVRYVQTFSKGLSKNRNNAIKNISENTNIVYFCDDDVVLTPNFIEKITSKQYEVWDVATFMVEDENNCPFKLYSSKEYIHNWRSLLKVSSIEVAIKVPFLKGTSILFDEQFGLGAEFSASEENIFLSDLLKKNAIIKFFPVVTVKHPLESSGRNWQNEALISAKGPFFKRVFGSVNGYLLLVLFAIKKWPEYRKSFGFFKFLITATKSFIKYKI